jgi:hypothetical protein
MNTIATIHQKVLDYFIKLRKDDPTFYFAPRKINNKGRLDEGYWFIGNEHYAHISFWNGIDWKEKIHNIGFVIHSDKTSKIELSAQDSEEKADFLEKVAYHLKGFIKDPSKNKWYKDLDGTDYLSAMSKFIKHDKPVIDRLLDQRKPPGILKIDKAFYDHYVTNVVDRRNEQIAFGAVNKITRITWNTEKWQRPSGSSGKSLYSGAYEANTGYGHEEWLFDKTSIIDGYHYAFLQSLNLESDKHVGKTYNISLFTTNNLGKKYEIGIIQKVECISKKLSADIHAIYEKNGWLKRMENDLLKVNADVRKFKQMAADQFFNIRFQFRNVLINDELVEISDEDVNVTTNHFKLLPKKTDTLNFNSIEIDSGTAPIDDLDSGNLKNTDRRKKTFNTECEYDPYHDMMQNCLFKLLSTGLEGYNNVKIEKGRVDIKAKTQAGNWHYFEIKTDSPKLSIRKALGQVMEYAYFPSSGRAERLIIIADEEPSDETLKYLRFIRAKFGLPIYYRALDIELGKLSKEF